MCEIGCMKKICIIQPAVPLYRKPLFERLSDYYEINLFTAETDFLGVSSVSHLDVQQYKRDCRFLDIFGGVFFWQLKLEVPFAQCDFLVVNGNPRILSSLFLLVIARFKGIKTIWWGHGWSSTSKPWRARLRQFMTRILADKVLLYTDKERDAYIELGFPADRVYSLNNGIDTSASVRLRGELTDSELKSFKFCHGLEGKKILLFIGRLTEKSRADLLLRSLIHLDDSLSAVFIGDGPERQLLLDLVDELGIQERVIFVGALFDEHVIAHWMMIASVFVYPGAVGLSLLHAFSYGLPAVIHSDDSKHMPEHAAFCNGYNGCSFERDNTESLASSISYVIGSQDYSVICSNALKTVQDSYNLDDMVRRFVQALD